MIVTASGGEFIPDFEDLLFGQQGDAKLGEYCPELLW